MSDDGESLSRRVSVCYPSFVLFFFPVPSFPRPPPLPPLPFWPVPLCPILRRSIAPLVPTPAPYPFCPVFAFFRWPLPVVCAAFSFWRLRRHFLVPLFRRHRTVPHPPHPSTPLSSSDLRGSSSLFPHPSRDYCPPSSPSFHSIASIPLTSPSALVSVISTPVAALPVPHFPPSFHSYREVYRSGWGRGTLPALHCLRAPRSPSPSAPPSHTPAHLDPVTKSTLPLISFMPPHAPAPCSPFPFNFYPSLHLRASGRFPFVPPFLFLGTCSPSLSPKPTTFHSLYFCPTQDVPPRSLPPPPPGSLPMHVTTLHFLFLAIVPTLSRTSLSFLALAISTFTLPTPRARTPPSLLSILRITVPSTVLRPSFLLLPYATLRSPRSACRPCRASQVPAVPAPTMTSESPALDEPPEGGSGHCARQAVGPLSPPLPVRRATSTLWQRCLAAFLRDEIGRRRVAVEQDAVRGALGGDASTSPEEGRPRHPQRQRKAQVLAPGTVSLQNTFGH
ncbi:hypothetical protein DFH09DRAFT_1406284 [Mycena vulgaris]|nr:hypothetical protein DFH09DRAFT_1406284 [Mycena vulgaris]